MNDGRALFIFDIYYPAYLTWMSGTPLNAAVGKYGEHSSAVI